MVTNVTNMMETNGILNTEGQICEYNMSNLAKTASSIVLHRATQSQFSNHYSIDLKLENLLNNKRIHSLLSHY